MAVLAATLLSTSAAAQMLIDEMAGARQPVVSAPRVPSGGSVRLNDMQAAWNGVCDDHRERYRVSETVKRWPWTPEETLCVEVRELAQTRIVFPETEILEIMARGDTEAFRVSRPDDFPNVLTVEPTDIVGADTVLHVAGILADGRRNYYSFYLRSFPVDHEQFPDTTVFVEAVVPGTMATEDGGQVRALSNGGFDKISREAAAEPTPDYLREVPFDIAKLRHGQWSVCPADEESAQIAPLYVYNDNHFVYVDYGEERADAVLKGSLHRVVDGVDNPANFRVTGPTSNIVVVEHMGYDLTITNGARVVCLKYRKPC